MRVAVCIKRIADPEVPASMFSIDRAGDRAVFRDGTRWVVSPFDEQAIEAALRIRDDLGEVEIVGRDPWGGRLPCGAQGRAPRSAPTTVCCCPIRCSRVVIPSARRSRWRVRSSASATSISS